MLLNCVVGEDSWESLGLQGYPTSPFWRRSVLGVHWRDWCWSCNSNTSATWCRELTHLKRPRCWERLRAGREGDNRGWDGWMASLTKWTWVWVNSGSSWGQGGLAFCGPWGCKELDTTKRLNWTELNWDNPGLSHFKTLYHICKDPHSQEVMCTDAQVSLLKGQVWVCHSVCVCADTIMPRYRETLEVSHQGRTCTLIYKCLCTILNTHSL